MLVLTRKVGESIMLGDNVMLTVSRISGNRVRISIEAPRECAINRSECAEAKAGQKKLSAAPVPVAAR
ncbi:carbon storage regulator [Planctomicrobium sp. SH664]|uniref:carbon storage regulator n=1 Tax=Planctomicrobium sp. SH664 TaxID=3448125 RepID=UPI003F5AFCD7